MCRTSGPSRPAEPTFWTGVPAVSLGFSWLSRRSCLTTKGKKSQTSLGDFMDVIDRSGLRRRHTVLQRRME